MTGSADGSKASGVTTLTGVFLLAIYVVFDSFTANWQSDLFKCYGMTSLQMIYGVNIFQGGSRRHVYGAAHNTQPSKCMQMLGYGCQLAKGKQQEPARSIPSIYTLQNPNPSLKSIIMIKYIKK
uniref:Adenosine 3'-phospho 5'-phosphosulfate transporter 1 n=1 Tax=Glossina pallidipes TaxID=7398 RepID=A0A1B0AJG6_GLOPL